MPSHVQLSLGSAEALTAYRELGELTDKELENLHHNYTKTARMNYLRNIYGYHAGAIARGVYERWAGNHSCSKCPV